jgi:hypothetical protein
VQLLLAYHFSLLVLLTVLIYVAGMMFIYREDAGTLVHTYWNDFNDKMTMLDTDWVAFVDEVRAIPASAPQQLDVWWRRGAGRAPAHVW